MNIGSIFSYITAIYFLSLPPDNVWIFPNCRVHLRDQIEAVRAAGVFTSTEVKLGPGGYIPALIKKNEGNKKYLSFIKKQIREDLGINYSSPEELERELDLGEQFLHHYDSHEVYIKAFKEAGLEICAAVSLKPANQMSKKV